MNDHLATLSRYKLLVLLVALVMGVAAYLVTDREAAQYQASSKLLVNQNASGLPSVGSTASVSDPTEFERPTSTQVHLGQIPEVAAGALRASDVHDMTPAQLLPAVTLNQEPKADIINIAVTAGTPRRAERLSVSFANAFADYQSGLLKAQLSRELSGVRATIDRELRQAGAGGAPLTDSPSFQQLLTLRNQLAAGVAAAPRSSIVVGPAQSAVKTSPKPIRNAALAGLLGLLLGSGLAFLFDARDRRARRGARPQSPGPSSGAAPALALASSRAAHDAG